MGESVGRAGNDPVTTAPSEVAVLGAREVEGLTPTGRRVLAILTLRAGRVVGMDEILEAAWGPTPPPNAAKSVQNQIVRIRRAFGPGTIATEASGYRLLISTDVARFEHLARTDPSAALELWQREPWIEIEDFPPASIERARLAEIRMTAEEAALERSLEVSRAEVLVAQDPFRERRWCLLMRALYASGRQADALETAQRARSCLREELGVSPGPELVELERAILRHDPSLRVQPPLIAVDADVALRLSGEAIERGDFPLGVRWLRLAGDATGTRIALASALVASGDVAAGVNTIADVVDDAIAADDLPTAVRALAALARERGSGLLTPRLRGAIDATSAREDKLDGARRATFLAAQVLIRATTEPAAPLQSLAAEAAAIPGLADDVRRLVRIAQLFLLDRPHDANARLALADEIERMRGPDTERLAGWVVRWARRSALFEMGDPAQEAVRAEIATAGGATTHAVDRVFAAAWGGGRPLLDGDLVGADAEATEWIGAYAGAEELGLAAAAHVSFMFTIRWMQQRLGELLPLVDYAAGLMPEMATWRSARSMVLASVGRAHDARDELAAFFNGHDVSLDVGSGLWSATVFHLSYAVTTLQLQEYAEQLIPLLSPVADRHAIYLSHHLGPFHHHLGALYDTLGDKARARGHFTDAVGANESLGSRWWLRRSQERRARLDD